MIKFRKSRRDSELSLMAQMEVNRRSSAVSLTGLRRESVDGELYLTVPQFKRRGSTITDDDVKVIPAITKSPSDDNISIHSDEITIDLTGVVNKAKVTNGSSAQGQGDIKVNGSADDRRVSTASMVYGEGKADFKVNNSRIVRRIWMNIVVVSIAFMLMFSSISALAALQSSIHEGNLGVVGLAVNFGTVVVSCIFLPHLLTRYCGYKWTLTICMLGGVGWMISNIFAMWETVIPGSVLLGLTWAPMWTAHSAYVTTLAKKFAFLTSVSKEEAINRFFGVFYTMFLTAPVWGNLVSAGVLGGFGAGSGNATIPDDEEANRELLKYCGANFCPLKEVPLNETAVQVERPTFEQISLLVGVNVGITMVGCLMTAIFVDREKSPHLKLPPQAGEKDDEEPPPIKELLLSTIKQTLRKKQLLIMPFTIYVGLEQAFLIAEFTGAFIGCAVGIEYVSLCIICYGLVGGLFAIIMGKLVEITGRLPIFLAAAVVQLALLIFMLLWHLERSHLPLLFVVPALWGIGDSIFQSQLNSMYGNVFSDSSEAAFANYRMFESVGFILGYGYSGLLCVNVKIYILLALLILSVVGYVIVEVWLKRKALAAATTAEQTTLKARATIGNSDVTTGSPIGDEVAQPQKRPVKKTSASSAPTLETMAETDV